MFLSSLIGGVKSSNHKTFHSINPADTSDVVGSFSEASLDECRQACQTARDSFEQWKSVPAPVRANIIGNFGDLITKNKEALCKILTREVGKTIREARGDVQEAIDTCHFFLSEGRRLYGQTVPSEMSNKELFTYRRPIGVFACITAGNFPFAVPSWYFVPALVCGNTCVWKPPEDAPYLSLKFAELLHAAGVPKGVFNVVFGTGANTGANLVSLVDEGLIDKVGFTGSSEVGKSIGEVCGRNLQTPCLELGGKNPMIVMPDANLDLAAHGAVWSGFGTAGQRCTSLGNLIVHESIKDTLMSKVLKLLAEKQIGDPTDENTFYGPLISEKFYNNHLNNLKTLIQPHHKVLTNQNGQITSEDQPKHFLGNPEKGFYAFPTIVDNVSGEDEIFYQETFGPLFNVIKFETFDEALLLANKSGYGLSAAIYTENIQSVYRFKNEIGAGMASINNGTSGAEAHLPFGGNGKSGNGSRQSGIWVLDQFTKWQSINWDMSGKLQLAQIETHYTEASDYTVTN